MRTWPLALLAFLACTGQAHAAAALLPCHEPFATLLSDMAFARYPSKLPARKIRPAAPDVRKGTAHLYRTAIREGAAKGPDFAGRYTLIRIGCGAATVCVAIADARTGRIFFPPALRSAEALLADTGAADVPTLNYRRGSRLLIVVGSPNEKPERAGLHEYVWEHDTLRRLRFTPAARLCSLPRGTRF